MKIIYWAAALFLSSQLILKAQEPDPNSFFPHAVGNIWEYDFSQPYRYEITKDSLSDNQIFLYYNNFLYPLYNLDTTNHKVFFLPTYTNSLKYKLDADSGETWVVHPQDSSAGRSAMVALVQNKYQTVIWQKPSTVLEIEFWNLNWGDTVINQYSIYENTEILASGFGLLFDWTDHGYVKFILGCVIDKDTFGTITHIIDQGNNLPNSYELFQNYPNPFNPATNIQYSIPQSGYVSLIVYDLLGNQIAELVNEWKQAGFYEVRFDGSNLASGIYIYRIITNGLSQFKKMILLK